MESPLSEDSICVEGQPLCQTANELPHPQVVEAFGFLNVNPRLFNPPCQSIYIPYKYIS